MSAQWQAACQQCRDAVASGDWGDALPMAASSKDEFAPPASLLAFPVLVDLANALLRSFNELRAFAPVEVAAVLAAELKSCLDLVASAVEDYGARAHKDARFPALAALLADDALPFFARCFAAVIGQAAMADVAAGAIRRVRVAAVSVSGAAVGAESHA